MNSYFVALLTEFQEKVILPGGNVAPLEGLERWTWPRVDVALLTIYAYFVHVVVIDWLHEFVSYPDFDAVKCHVPGAPVNFTYPLLFVVPLNECPPPSVAPTLTPDRGGPLVLFSQT